MATFLERHGASSPTASVAGLHLSQHIERIDAYIDGAHQNQTSTQMDAARYMPRKHRTDIIAEDFQLSAVGDELGVVVPLEYLQHIPWPGLIELDMNWPSIGVDDLEG